MLILWPFNRDMADDRSEGCVESVAGVNSVTESSRPDLPELNDLWLYSVHARNLHASGAIRKPDAT